MANPVTYNSGSNPSGALKFGTVSMSVAPSLNITGYNWRNGFDSNSIWTIYSDTYSQGLSTQGNSIPTIWATPQFTEQGLIDLINVLPARAGLSKFTTLSSAITWLTGEGKYFISNQNYPQMITDGLQFFVDAGLTASYPQVNSSWYELSGSLTGQLNNTPTWANYKTKSYFIFDGTDDWTNFSNNTNLNSNAITVSSWFNPDAVTQNGFLFEKGYVNTQYALFFEGSSFKLRFMFSNIGTSDFQVTGSDYMTAGRWYNATVTYDGSVAKMYINGTNVLTTTYNGTIPVNNNGERIGSWYDGSTTGYHFDGAIAKTLVYNRALTNSEVLLNYYEGNIVTSGLVFNIDAANLVSYPSVGTAAYNLTGSNILTLSNGLSYQSGYGGYFLSDGTDDGLTTPDASNLDLSTFTLEGWVWWNQHKDYASLLVKGPGGSGGLFNYCFFFYAGNIVCGFGDGSSFYNVSINTPTTNTWHHIVGTYDGTTLKFYLDGVLATSSGIVATPYQNTSDLNVIQTAYPIDGRVANARVYNRALTATEVLQNYGATRGRFQFYGAYANGGTVTTLTQNGVNYRVHTFTSSGTLSVTQSGSVEVLVVAGGGGGGGSTAGGGGAGGVIYNSAYQLTSVADVTVTVGSGGVGSRKNDDGTPNNTNGNNSVFGLLTAIGGGYGFSGGPSNSRLANSGGSGGGAGFYGGNDILVNSPGAGTSGQGFAGGTVVNYGFDWWGGAGGGGAGGEGAANVQNNSLRTGGPGLPFSISGTTTYYGGGGGGGCFGNGTGPSPGGQGGGGNGGDGLSFIATSGTINTGGGGGGSGYYQFGPNPSGGNGGSGVVIVRYVVP